MPATIVIVADDLTGAADCGIACTLAGLPTVVAFGDLARAWELDADVIAFDTDTRRAAPGEAAEKTHRAVETLGRSGVTKIVYKKIDSTLRGNVGIEIAASRHAASVGIFRARALAIVAPAFPSAGRTTRDGRMLLAGELLEKSAVWRNEKITGNADLSAMIGWHGRLNVGLLRLETVRSGAERIATALEEFTAADKEAVVCDAETEDDLRAIAQAAARMRGPAIFAGSAGLMRHLPEAFGLPKEGRAPAASRTFSPGPLLFVVGSMSEVSREGLRTLAAEPGVRTFTLPPSVLLGGENSTAWGRTVSEIVAAASAGEDVGLALGLEDGVDLRESAALSLALARFVLPLAPRFAGLFLTGGETARALLNAAGAAGIRLIGEVEPGVPMGTAEGWHDLPVITKAGAFGNAQTLVRARAALRGEAAGGLKTMTFR